MEKIKLMNDGTNEMYLTFDSNKELAQIEVSDSFDEVFFDINEIEAKQIIEGLQKFINKNKENEN